MYFSLNDLIKRAYAKSVGVIYLSEYRQKRHSIYGQIPANAYYKIEDWKTYKAKLAVKAKQDLIKESNIRVLASVGRGPDGKMLNNPNNEGPNNVK